MKIGFSSLIQTKTNIHILRLLRRQLSFLYLYSLVWLYYLPQNKNIMKAIGRVFPGLSRREQLSSLQSVYRGLAWHYTEKIDNITKPIPKLKSFFDERINGRKNLADFLSGRQGQKGILLLTGHFGGVEYLPLFFALENHKTSIIADFSSRWLRERSLAYAARFGINVINAGIAKNGMQEIFKDLKNGRIVIFLIDELKYWREASLGEVEFLGQKMPFFRGLSTVARGCRHYGIPCYFGGLAREGKEYRFFASPIALAAGSAEPGRQALKHLEKAIYKNPAQWYQWPKLPLFNSNVCF